LVNGITRKRMGLFNVHHNGKLIHDRLWIPSPDDFPKTTAGAWIEYETHRPDYYPTRYQVLEQTGYTPDWIILLEVQLLSYCQLGDGTYIQVENMKHNRISGKINR
jgi:hypothetical protein